MFNFGNFSPLSNALSHLPQDIFGGYERSLETLFLESSNLPLRVHYPICTYAHANINLPSPPLQGTQGEEGEESKPSSSQQKDADPETADATSTGIINIYYLKRA